MSSPSFTSTLLTLHPTLLTSATTHPFLTSAGRGTLSSRPLCAWLVQDKFYQFAYVQFIGRLISKIDLGTYDLLKPGDNVTWDTFSGLLSALGAIRSEIEFYDKTVEKYGLKLEDAHGSKVTEEYVKLFEESSGEGKPLVCGLVVLWATEYVYLRAWSHAKEQQGKSDGKSDDKSDSAAVEALNKEFIPNWTSDDFQAAVKELARLADAWADSRPEDTSTLDECQALWKRVLELETDFWPDV